MSARQARIARKQRQRDGLEVFIHDGPMRGTRPYETARAAKQRRSDENQAAEAARAAVLASRGWIHRAVFGR